MNGWDRRAADALADEVAVLVRRHVIDSRSPAADALLDYRDPPSTQRADRMAELERALAKAEQERDELRTENERLARHHAGRCAERDAAVADNAALWSREAQVRSLIEAGAPDHALSLIAEAQRHERHPGAALLEQHRKELERLSAALADMLRTAENWGHGADCPGDDDAEQNDNCECGKAEILAVLSPPDGSLPGAAFLARRDALAKDLKEARRGLVRARNEGLERAAQECTKTADETPWESEWAGEKPPVWAVTRDCMRRIRALKEPEE
jgi:hypothetical protein